MSTLNILLNQIGMFVIYILAGIILIRTHVLNRENMEVVSRLVIKLALPVMIFTNTVNGVDKQMLFHSPADSRNRILYVYLSVWTQLSFRKNTAPAR